MGPIECNPRIHSAICTLEGHRNLGAAYTDAEYMPRENAEVVTSQPKALRYWVMDQLFLMAGFWKHKNCFKLSLREMITGTDALLHGDDPMPFLAMYLVQIPSLLGLELWAGKPWLKVHIPVVFGGFRRVAAAGRGSDDGSSHLSTGKSLRIHSNANFSDWPLPQNSAVECCQQFS